MTNNKQLTADIVDALVAKYRGEMAEAKANIKIYLENPVGIGEHPDVLAAIDTQIQAMANAQEKLDALATFSKVPQE
jgi:hypothetical protein